jgi:hypothetical protein
VRAVEIEDADASLFFGRRIVSLGKPHQPERHAEHVADSHGDRLTVLPRPIAFEHVHHDLRLPAEENLFRNAPAGFERRTGERSAAARAPQLEFEVSLGIREHDEAAFGAAYVERGIEHQCQDFFEHPAGTHGPEPFQQGRHLPQISDGQVGHPFHRAHFLADEQQLRVGAAATNPIQALQFLFAGYAVAVDESAVARILVPQHKPAVLPEDFRVLARHFLACQLEVVFGSPPDRKQIFIDADHTAALFVVELEAGFRHG